MLHVICGIHVHLDFALLYLLLIVLGELGDFHILHILYFTDVPQC